MNSKILSRPAQSMIDRYMHFKLGSAVCRVPYFNNKRVRTRAGLRAQIGKGSPEDIREEAETLAIKNHIRLDSLADESLKKFLVDNNIGVECSGFAYYILDSESTDRHKGTLGRHLTFANHGGIIAKMRCHLRPAENCNVATLADNENSRIVPLDDVEPGDFISMQGGPDKVERDHILLIHQIDYDDLIPHKIYYSHAVEYPEDGLYDSGIRQGTIEIISVDQPITEGIWSESDRVDLGSRIYARAKNSRTEIRRLKWF